MPHDPMAVDLMKLSELARAVEAITPPTFSKYQKLLETLKRIKWKVSSAKKDRLVIFERVHGHGVSDAPVDPQVGPLEVRRSTVTSQSYKPADVAPLELVLTGCGAGDPDHLSRPFHDLAAWE